MKAIFESDGRVTRVGSRERTEKLVKAADVEDPQKLARLVQDLRRDVDALKGEWRPTVVLFRDVAVSTGGATVALRHGLGGRVLWSVVSWSSATGAGHSLGQTSATTGDALVLASQAAGTATIRVEVSP